MSTDLLFEHFATLATAPDGIARFRELILQLAVQGKLGTQDAGDELAKILPRITKERKNESDGKTRKKKENVGDPIDLDNVSSSCIQKGWTICRLSDCLELINGRAYSMPELLSEGTPIIRIQNLNGGKDWYYSNLNLEPDKYCDDGDLLFAWSGTFGPYIWNGSKSIYHYHIWKIKLSNSILDSFAFYLLKHLSDKIRSASHGLMLPHMTKQDMENVLIRLPPLAEQHRIVAKVDRLMAICDELEVRQLQERAGCLRLGTASLAGLQNATHPEEFERQWVQVCDAFDLILDCPENVAVFRQTILQLAVLGQMDTHDAKDEPVEKIIERIRKAKERMMKDGKIKPEKILESGNEIEIPFVIPKTWKWMKLSAISAFVTDGDHYPPQRVLKGIPHLTAKNVRDKKLNLIGCTFISHEDFEKVKMRYEPREDDVIITCVGTIGQTAIVPPNFVFSADRNLAAIRLFDGTFFPKFLQMILNASYWQNKVMTGSESTAQPHLYLKDLRSFDIPLPPLAEQDRIVAKVDALMALCDALESRLKERAEVQGRLAGAVVKQVAGRG